MDQVAQIVILYRYPHPFEQGRWVYVGQGAKRDKDHRSGRTSFGLRFQRVFPNIPLPQPYHWCEPATTQMEANRAETDAINSHHTWLKEGGMNVASPGLEDYKESARLAGLITKAEGLGLFGRSKEKRIEDARNAGRIGGKLGGHITGSKMKKRPDYFQNLGQLSAKSGRNNPEKTRNDRTKAGKTGGRATNKTSNGRKSNGGRVGGKISGPTNGKLYGVRNLLIANCVRWKISRGKSCVCGEHKCL